MLVLRAQMSAASMNRCFACDHTIKGDPKRADTRDAQIVFVGPCCYAKIRAAGEAGYQPPKGGPRLYPLNTWIDSHCFYVSIVDGPRFNLIAGPFETHQEALDMVDKAREVGTESDPRGHFYGWGTVKMKNGHREGVLNKRLGL